MGLDALVHKGLRKHGLVHLVVTVSAIAYYVEHHVVVVLGSVIQQV